MKKILILILILIFSVNIFGQQVVDNLLKARAEIESGDPDAAINILNRAIASAKDSRLYTERAEASILKGDYSSAISDYNEANKIEPASGEYGLSRIYALKGDAATSLYHLTLNLNSPYRKAEKDIMLDPAFNTLDNRSEWRQFWKKDWYSTLEKNVSEIEYYTSSGKLDESKDLLSELKRNYPDKDEIIYAQALVDLYSGKYPEAVNDISKLTNTYPENEKYLRVLAKAQTMASNPSGASVTYTKLLDAGIADADLFLLRAECYRKTGENDKALSDILKYLGYYPDNRTALSLAGKVEAVSGDNLKALDYFSRNLKVHPNDPECYIDMANSYFASKSWKWAIADYSMSLDLDPGNSDAWLNKGIALLNSGNTEDAFHDFRISFRLGNKRATEYISRYCIK
jgi:tetratricopeptide (TPR) repeat protein